MVKFDGLNVTLLSKPDVYSVRGAVRIREDVLLANRVEIHFTVRSSEGKILSCRNTVSLRGLKSSYITFEKWISKEKLEGASYIEVFPVLFADYLDDD